VGAERELLFAVMAVQLGLAQPGQAMAAASAWAAERGLGVGARLTRLGLLTPEKQELLERLIDESIRAHAGDERRALETFGGGQAVEASLGGSLILGPAGSKPAEPAGLAPEPTSGQSEAVTLEQPGRYRLSEDNRELGRGGIGRVLLAVDEHLGREVAIKELLHPGGPQQPQPAGSAPTLTAALVRFLREARVTGQLEHPGIVPVHELGRRRDGTFYYTMRVVRGRTLGAALAECSGLGERLRLLGHFVDLCQTMAYAHSRGVVHRDIKPENVMLGEFGETVVLDWGLARVRGQMDIRGQEVIRGIREVQDTAGCRTLDGSALGTPAYMSPEQAEGRLEAIDERSDVWCLGAVLHHILTGEPPFTGATAFEVLGRVMRESPAPVLARCPAAPPELASVTDKALQRDPGRRYAGARELAHEVEAFLTGGRVRAHAYSVWNLLGRFAARHKAPLVVLAAALVALLATGVLAYLRVGAERDRALGAEAEASLRLAQAHEEAARAAALRGDPLEARSRLRSALEISDSPSARLLWSRLQQDSTLWSSEFGDAMYALAWSHDGALLAVGGEDRVVRLLDSRTRRLEHALRGHADYVNAVAFSPDGRVLASGSADGTVILWDPRRGGRLRTLEGHAGEVWTVEFDRQGRALVSASADHTVRVWSLSGEAPAVVIPGSSGAWCATFAPRGGRVAVGRATGEIEIWHPGAGQPERVLTGHTRAIQALDYSPDGDTLASASLDRSVRLWAPDTGEQRRCLEGHQDNVMAVRFSPDGARLLSASFDRTLRLWDAAEGRPLGVLARHANSLMDAVFDPSGTRVASTGYDHVVRVGLTAPMRAAEGPPPHRQPLNSVACSPDGTRIATGDGAGRILLWDAASGVRVAELSHAGPVDHVVFGRDPQTLLSQGAGVLRCWDLGRGAQRWILGGSSDRIGIQPARLSPDGRTWVVRGGDRRARLFDAESGALRLTLREQDIGHIGFLPDGSLFGLLLDGRQGRWEAGRGRRLGLLRGPEDSLHLLVADGRGGHVAATGDRGVWLWEPMRQEFELVWTSPDAQPFGLAFHPGHRLLAVGAGDGSAYLVDLDTRAARRLVGHLKRQVAAVDFSADGAWLASVGEDASLRLWRVADGRPGSWSRTWLAELLSLAWPETPGSGAMALRVEGGRVLEVLVGHTDGGVTRHSWPAGAEIPFVLEASPSSQVTSLLALPRGTLAVGFADGRLGLWQLSDGANLVMRYLHGPVRWLAESGERLWAGSELGEVAEIDLATFSAPYCDFLGQVRTAVPTVWRAGAPSLAAVDALPACRPARDRAEPR